MQVTKSNSNGTEWNIIEDLKRLMKIYDFLEYIIKNPRCCVREIKKALRFPPSTVYGYVEKAHDWEKVIKIPTKGTNKNGTQFLLEGTPELKGLLDEFEKIIIDFLKRYIKDN